MTNTSPAAGGIAWGHLRRWFLAGRVFRIAAQVRLLTLASVGVLATIGGWGLFAWMFSGTNDPALQSLIKSFQTCPWNDFDKSSTVWDSLNPVPGLARGPDGGKEPIGGPKLGTEPVNATLDPWSRLTAPVVFLFETSRTDKAFEATRTFVGATFLSLCIIWAAAVWGFFGGAITRGSILQLAREESPPMGSLVRHAGRRWLSYFTAPLFPLVGVMLVTFGLLFLGLIMHLSIFFASLFWPLALIGGVVMAILMAGLSIGWPLMHAAISAEGNDAFDALSRSYSYVYQRPLHYLLYAIAATLLGLLGLFVAVFFADLVWNLTAWSASWGSGNELMQKALQEKTTAGMGWSDRWGINIIKFWHGGINLVVVGFAFSFFWSAASAVYLLLRYDADGADLDEIYQDDGPEIYGLPSPAAAPASPPAESPTPGVYQAEPASEQSKTNIEPPPPAV